MAWKVSSTQVGRGFVFSSLAKGGIIHSKTNLSPFFISSNLASFVLFIVGLALPIYTQITDKEIHPQVLLNGPLLPLSLGIVAVLGLLSGFYPAFFLSTFNNSEVLKGKLTGRMRHSGIKNGLVVFQFVISIALIFSTLIISDQLNYMMNKDLGFEKDHLIYIPMDEKIAKEYQAFKVEASKNPDVFNVAATSDPPTNYLISSGAFRWEGKDPSADNIFYVAAVDFDFVETFFSGCDRPMWQRL